MKNFYEFFETFKERNIFRDDQLAELVERAQAILGGQSAESIRSDEQIKEHIEKAMKEVEKLCLKSSPCRRRKDHHELTFEIQSSSKQGGSPSDSSGGALFY